ncbi:MFS transporter, partial [Salmonella enterica subsp. enterica serovar Infantis]
AGAALMPVGPWKVRFGTLAVRGRLALCGLLLAMPATVHRGAVPVSAGRGLREVRTVFRTPICLPGAATLSGRARPRR